MKMYFVAGYTLEASHLSEALLMSIVTKNVRFHAEIRKISVFYSFIYLFFYFFSEKKCLQGAYLLDNKSTDQTAQMG